MLAQFSVFSEIKVVAFFGPSDEVEDCSRVIANTSKSLERSWAVHDPKNPLAPVIQILN